MAFGAIMGQTPLVETSPLDRIGLYQILTGGDNTGNWTPPYTGKYLITVIGPGGDGGNGANLHSVSIDYNVCSGSAGGSGGVCIFELDVQQITSFNYQITDEVTIWKSPLISCYSGQPGQNGASQPKATGQLSLEGGKGGAVIASDVSVLLKANGLPGKNSILATPSQEPTIVPKGGSLPAVVNFPSFYGGKTGILLGSVVNGKRFEVIDRNNGVVTTFSDVPFGGMFGVGGDAGPSCITNPTPSSQVNVATGAKGGDGAIIIQYLGKD